MTKPDILTQRLKLSPLLAGDAPAIYEYRSEREVCRYQSFEPGSLNNLKEFISSLQLNFFNSPGIWFQFAIRLRESELFLGDLGTHVLADDPCQVELGITLSGAHQGKGCGTEAFNAMVDHFLRSLHKHRVFASVDPRNDPCVRLLKRVGMRQEAHFRRSLRFKGEWVDDMVFGFWESEWKTKQK